MVLYVFIYFLGGVPLCIPFGLYSGTSLGGTTRGILGGFPGRVLSILPYYVFWVGLSQIWELFCFALVLIGKFLVKNGKLPISSKSDALRLGVGALA